MWSIAAFQHFWCAARDSRFHGVFAPNSRHRQRIVPGRKERPKGEQDQPRAPMTWMQRLKRIFAIDKSAGKPICTAVGRHKVVGHRDVADETCPDYGGRLRVIACIEEPDLIRQILAHVRTREGSPDHGANVEARAPPVRDLLDFS